MSHEQVELQRILSNGSSHLGSNTAMSASGSFGSDHMHHHTDADDTPNPVYFSIPESQVAHQQYKANRLQQQTSTSPNHTPATSPSYPDTQIAQPPTTGSSEVVNQYDFIPDRHKARVIDSTPKNKSVAEKPAMGAAGTPGMLQAENILYAGTEEANQMRHKTLTMSNTDTFRRFHGEGSPEVIVEGKEYDRSCRGCVVLLWGGCVTGLVVIALAGVALALAILFTGIVGVCSTACTGGNVDSSLSQSNQELIARVDMLEKLVESLNRTVNSQSVSSTDSISEPAVTTSGVMSTNPASMATPTTESTPQEITLSLNNVNLYMDCNTSIEQKCGMGPGEDNDLQCQTPFGHSYMNPGDFVMDISCVRVGTSTEQNGLTFVLSIDEANNEVQCFCYVVDIVGSGSFSRGPVTCGLQVTRCRTFTSINTTATLTP